MKRYAPRILMVMLLAGSVCAVYWATLLNTQRDQLVYAEEQTRLRAVRLAEVMALQVETLFSGLAYLNNSLAVKYLVGNKEYFLLSIKTALATFPADSIQQIAVADAQGNIVYSSLDVGDQDGEAEDGAPVSIADREHFLIHSLRDSSELYVGHPVLGRVSNQWSIQLSYPLRRDGEFLGVVVLSISPDYISGYFRELFAEGNDVAVLLYSDGTYIARSTEQGTALNTRVPADREFLQRMDQKAGDYLTKASFDGVERYYAWHRVKNYPLIVSLGLERSKAFTTLLAHQRDALIRNAIGSGLILIAVFWISLLVARRDRDQKLLVASERRFKLALQGGNLGAWDWDVTTQVFLYDQAWCAMLGYAPGELPESMEIMRNLMHPDDWGKVQEQMYRHLKGELPVFDSEHRLRHKSGRWVWVSIRGGITSWDDNGQPVKIAGVQADISLRMADSHMRQALFDNSAVEIILTHPCGRRVLSANKRAVETFAPPGRDLTGLKMETLHINHENFLKFGQAYQEVRQHSQTSLEQQFKTSRNGVRWYVINGTLLDPAVPDGEVIWTLLDITERRQMEQRFADTRVRLIEVIEHVPGGVLVEDESGIILVTNQELYTLLHIAGNAGSLIGRRVEELGSLLSPEGVKQLDSLLTLVQDGPWRQETELIYGEQVLQISVTTVQRDDQSRGRLWIVTDITERLRHESDLNRQANTDGLTGLANRPAFLRRLDAELGALSTRPHAGVLLMADLDHFKRVNDTYGHAAGDEVLRFLAGVFQVTLRKTDLVGRIGGEEFAVLLPGVRDEEGRLLAERLRMALEVSEIPTTAGIVRITISIGMARLDEHTPSKDILAAADAALYRAKHNGRNRVEVA